MIEPTSYMSDLQNLLVEGLRHHQSGQLAQAESCYRQILQADSRHADALHLLGLIAHQVGRNEDAVALMRNAIGLVGDEAAFHSNLGNALCGLACLDEAIAAYRTALCIRPFAAETYINLGQALKDRRQPEEAIKVYRVALRLKPDRFDAGAKLGALLHDLRRMDDAVTAYRALLLCKPDNAECYYNHGLALYGLGRLVEAVPSYRAAVRLKPDFAEGHANLGVALKDLGRLDDAVAAYSVALRIKPSSAATRSNLGNALKALGRVGEAVGVYRAALCLNPDFADAQSNLGNALRDMGCLDAAVAAFDAALRIEPEHADTHYNRGNALKDLGLIDAAVAAYRAALGIKPDYAEAHANLGIALLLAGRLESGWRHYEWRWQAKEFAAAKRSFPQPQWRGERLEGKAILLHADQGLGDAIQFCRYVPLIAARGGRVFLEVHRPLLRLLRGLEGVERLIARGDALPSFDLHCPLMSLPLAFDTRIETIPATIPYLAADPDQVVLWRDRLAGSGLRVGIAWQGNPTYKEDRHRSIPLACFAPLAEIPGVHLISLQKRHGLEQLDRLPEGMRVERLEAFDEGDDAFIDAAAVMMSLDLIVTVDTAILHLAGALGRPVWLPLATPPHWVWMLQRDDSPWYPTLRLFRQKAQGGWQEVFERMAADLRSLTRRTVLA